MFLEICNMVKINKVPDNVIRLSLFPFSLTRNAKVWLHSFPENQGRQEITSFQQDYEESLSQTWERLKGLLRKKPMHGFNDLTQINIFLRGLRAQTKLMLDSSTGGIIKSKTLAQAKTLIENMASNNYEVQNKHKQLQKKRVLELQTHVNLKHANEKIDGGTYDDEDVTISSSSKEANPRRITRSMKKGKSLSSLSLFCISLILIS